MKNDEELPASFFRQLTFDLYNTVRLGNPMLYYQLDDAHPIDSFYTAMKGVKIEPGDPSITVGELVGAFQSTLTSLHSGMWSGAIKINKDLLLDLSRDSLH
ncbi:MAG: hypothetical protein WCE82_06255 [Halobacteriota archaeon]